MLPSLTQRIQFLFASFNKHLLVTAMCQELCWACYSHNLIKYPSQPFKVGDIVPALRGKPEVHR